MGPRWWTRWLTPPRFEDEVLTQRAHLLHRLITAVLIIIVPFGVAGIAVGPKPLFSLVIYGVFWAFHVVMLVLLFRGGVTAVGRTYVAVYFALMTLLIWFNGGVSPNHSAVYVTITLLAGLTMSPRSGIVVAALATLSTLVFGFAEISGRLPPAFQPTTIVEDMTSNIANLVFAAVFVTISMRGLREALERSRTATLRMEARSRQDAALAALGQAVLSAPGAAAFASAVVERVAETFGASAAVAFVGSGDQLTVLAHRGDHAHLLGVPTVTEPRFLEGATIASSLAGSRLATAPVPGKAGTRGALVVRLADGADDSLLTFLGTAASMLGTRLAQEEDHGLLRQAQKMEVVGRLAGGVAHDFNNLLTTILGCAALLEASARDGDVELVRDIKEASERAALMTRQLLAFSRKQVLRPEPVDLNLAVTEFRHVLQRLLRSDVAVELVLCDGRAAMMADRASLEQVLLNLAVNARDAMPKGGRLRIATRSDPSEVVLEVSDTGVGMAEATRARLFEPFFTTKADGTGLGLPTVQGIVQRLGGRIAVQSALGEGATFTLTFPRVTGAAAASRGPGRPLRGAGCVLVVDDDERVRATTKRVLESAGYEVVDVASGAEALAAAGSGPGFGLVVTDVVMNGMSGPELAEKLKQAGHAWPVLFVSGYVADHVPSEAFLAKPYQPADLIAAARRMLVAPAAGDALP